METVYELETFKVRLKVSESPAERIPYSARAARILRAIYRDLDADQEHFAALLLDNKNQIRGYKVLFTGSQASSLVHPAVVFRAAILFGACAIMLGHNHPSGNPSPSPDDHSITSRLVDCGELFGIRVLDHVILGKGSAYYSFSDCGLIGGSGFHNVVHGSFSIQRGAAKINSKKKIHSRQ